MFKRCIAVLLMAAMLMGVVPTAVHAAPVYYNEEIHTDFGELLYNLDDDAFWLMVYGYVQLDDKSAWYFAFLFQHPDFYSLLQAYKGFMFVMHNPVRFRDPWGLSAEDIWVMIDYIAQKNHGFTSHWSCGSYVSVWMGVTSRGRATSHRYAMVDLRVSDQGHVLIGHTTLMNDFGLTFAQATHQPWDRFSSMDSAAVAFSLMWTGMATALNNTFPNLEIGAMIYRVNTGNIFRPTTHYTFGIPWAGGVLTDGVLGANVVFGLVYNMLPFTSGRGRPLRSSQVALAHTHPQSMPGFSAGDRFLANNFMPVFYSRNPGPGQLVVNRYTRGIGASNVFRPKGTSW